MPVASDVNAGAKAPNSVTRIRSCWTLAMTPHSLPLRPFDLERLDPSRGARIVVCLSYAMYVRDVH